MIKRVYSHLLLLATVVCYIAVFTHLGTSVIPDNPLFRFGLAISLINLLGITIEVATASYFTEAGTLADIHYRQRVVLLLLYTFFFTFCLLFLEGYWFLVPAILYLFVAFHRGATNPDVVPTLLDLSLIIIWIIFLLEIL